jgi:hypothetical protein
LSFVKEVYVSTFPRRAHGLALAAALVACLCVPGALQAQGEGAYEFATPVFGLAIAPDGAFLVADAGAGIVRLGRHRSRLIAPLPGVTDVAPIGSGMMWATTGAFGPTAQKLFRVSRRGKTTLVADLGAFEAAVNPDKGAIDSNPFDVAKLSGGRALVADAAANALLIANKHGEVDWVATLPSELVSTANIKQLFGCPMGPPNICAPPPVGLPPMIPAQPVATSVAIGPDGAYYVGELKGFPAPTGESQVWRIEPGTRHAECGISPACMVVADGFTSIIDLAFGPDGTLYVVELDEASWFAVEFPQLDPGLGGTVNACETRFWTCEVVKTGLPQVTTVAVSRKGRVYAAINALIPGAAEIVRVK